MVQIEYRNAHIRLADKVYEPAEDSFLLADSAVSHARDGMCILEIGTGTGFVSAVLKANVNLEIIATDINPYAARCARSNGIEVIRTDMFRGLRSGPIFDLIIFNPPYLPTSDEEKVSGWLNYAFDGGTDGRAAVERFLDEAGEYMVRNGMILLLVSSLTGVEHIKTKMESVGFDASIVGRTRCFYEELVVLLGKRRA
jgi:release factor glutamine methyltransferase